MPIARSLARSLGSIPILLTIARDSTDYGQIAGFLGHLTSLSGCIFALAVKSNKLLRDTHSNYCPLDSKILLSYRIPFTLDSIHRQLKENT